ncbi:MAG: hypothetical protein AAGI68_16470 [Planctomycetota bacterium]
MRTFEQYVLENPWPVMVGCVVLWAVLRVLGRRRESRGLVIASWVVLLLGAGAGLLGHFVETRGEKLLVAVDGFLVAAGEGRVLGVDGMEGYVAPGLVATDSQGAVQVTWVEVRDRLQGVTIDELSYRVVPPVVMAAGGAQGAALEIDVRVTAGGQPVGTTRWRMNWVYSDADGWRVRELRWLAWRGENPDGLWRMALGR